MPTMELTDVFCRSAKATGGRQTDYFDTIRKGLCLRVSPGGARTWSLHYTRPADGKRARMKLGRYPDIGLGKARDKARDARASIGEGTDPVAEKRAHAASATVDDLIDSYLIRNDKVAKARTKPEIERRLRKNVSPIIGAMKLADLHRRDITRCIDAVKDRGAHIEANRLFEDIRAMVRWAKGRGDLDENIVEGMKRPTETVERDRFLTPDEIRSVWLRLPDADMYEGTRNVLRLCLLLGQRVGEVSGMTRDEIDFTTALWTIPAERSKNGRAHAVPLSDLALQVIRQQMAAMDKLAKRMGREVPKYIFPGPGGRAALSGAAVAKAVKRQEIKGRTLGAAPWTPHDLRRTAATLMEESGISPFVVGHILNHVSVTKSTITSRVYARYDYGKEKREALDLWADRLAAIVEGRGNVVQMNRPAGE